MIVEQVTAAYDAARRYPLRDVRPADRLLLEYRARLVRELAEVERLLETRPQEGVLCG